MISYRTMGAARRPWGMVRNLPYVSLILHSSSGHRPSDSISSSTSKMRNSQPSAALHANIAHPV